MKGFGCDNVVRKIRRSNLSLLWWDPRREYDFWGRSEVSDESRGDFGFGF